MLVLTRAVGDVGLLVLSGISDRLELLLRQQPPLFQQAPLLPLLPLFQNHLEVKWEKKNNKHASWKTNKHVYTIWSTYLFQSSRFLQFGYLSLLAFFHQRARRVQRIVGNFILLPERLLLGRQLFLDNRKSSTNYKEMNIFMSNFSVSVRLKINLIIFT